MLTPELAQIALAFLDRTQIAGSEARAMTVLQGELQKIMKPPAEAGQETPP